ncbi:MAG: hypothetical protein K0Q79_2436 [Flavipsychrobacter sp.]|jgi:Raf kinase inhibitor-like YbhB/YbcL family protein|nr:hypothetical protein [Flavipsychrobacter sp.]
MRLFTLAVVICIGIATSSFIKGTKSLTVTSSAFANNAPIPVKYTCKGPEFSPPLEFDNIPPETKSLAIIVEEPNTTTSIRRQKVCVPEKPVAKSKRAKRTTAKKSAIPLYETVQVQGCFTHWIIWNIDPSSKFIPENFINDNQGVNSLNECKYKGMCPSDGTHNYHFKVYALDTKLNISSKSDRAALEKVMEGHVLAWGEVVGTFNKNYK